MYSFAEFTERERHQGRLHPTFATKPVPMMQRQLQAMGFVGQPSASNRVQSTVSDHLSSPSPSVPVSWDEEYKPSDPDADWSGLVDKRPKKKIVPNHPSKIAHLEACPNGLTGDSEPKQRAPSGKQPRDTAFLIAGIASADPWRTSAQSIVGVDPSKKTVVPQLQEVPKAQSQLPEIPELVLDSARSLESSSNGALQSPRVGTIRSSLGSDLVTIVPKYEDLDVKNLMKHERVVPAKLRAGSSIKFG